MADEKILLCALLLLVCSSNEEAGAQEFIPSLQMSTSSRNFSAQMTSKRIYYYSFTIEHTPSSAKDAKGVHVTWMMTPFLQFKEVTSVQPAHIGSSPKVEFKDDSWVFKIGDLEWGFVMTVEFSVIFDPNATLRPGKHHLVTPVQLTYYDEYSEDQQGNVNKGIFFATPLAIVDLDFEVPGCSSALGMKTEQIKTYQISASSSYPEAQPAQAREDDDAWCAKDVNDQQYIQVDFEWKTRLTGLSTFRRKAKKHMVTKYSLLYSNDDVTWHEYNENGFAKKFEGNTDTASFDPVTHWLRHPIEANSFRIRPMEWKGLICLRFEVFGCVIEGSTNNCISPLGLESGEIKDEALSHSLPSNDPLSKPINIRLNKKVVRYPFGWQARAGQTDWLQVDFGSLRRLTRIAAMGGYTTQPHTDFFIKTYKLKYSNNSIDWLLYEHNGNTNLKGPKDRYEAKYPVLAKLAKPVIARYIRFVPNDGVTSKVVRAELYGCNAEQLPPYGDVPEYHRRSYLLDPVTDRFFVCMYKAERMESSCFSTKDGREWEALDSFIISVIASVPKDLELYGLDRSMNFYFSKDSGKTWSQVDERRFREQQGDAIVLASGISEGIVSSVPLSNYTTAASSGLTWGVSAAGIHTKAADSEPWSKVGSWKCCGN